MLVELGGVAGVWECLLGSVVGAGESEGGLGEIWECGGGRVWQDWRGSPIPPKPSGLCQFLSAAELPLILQTTPRASFTSIHLSYEPDGSKLGWGKGAQIVGIGISVGDGLQNWNGGLVVLLVGSWWGRGRLSSPYQDQGLFLTPPSLDEKHPPQQTNSPDLTHPSPQPDSLPWLLAPANAGKTGTGVACGMAVLLGSGFGVAGCREVWGLKIAHLGSGGGLGV